MQIRNFLFHRVSPENDMLWPPMKPKLFEWIIQQLTTQFEVVKLEDYLLHPKDYQPKKKLATVMFDDGFKDNLEYAAPILKKYNCAASFYVVTDCIQKNIPTWTYRLDYTILNTTKHSIVLNKELSLLKHSRYDISSYERRFQFAKMLKPQLKKLDHQSRLKTLEIIFSQLNDVELPQIMMNWQEVNQLKSDGFEIGSHSKSHFMLGTITEDKIIESELLESAKAIEQQTGKFPLTISYPVGSFNKNVMELARCSGYKFGLAVNQKFYRTSKDDLYAIPRMELYNESMFKTKLRMNGWIEKLKSLKKF